MNDKRRSSVKKAKIAYITYSIVLIALGVLLMFMRETQIELAAKIIGAILLCCGIVKFIAYFVNDAYGLAFQFDFALGLFTVIMGLLLFFHPLDMLKLINILVGIFVIVDGAFKLQTAKDARQFGMQYWWMILIFALFTTLAGLLLVFNPLGSMVAVTVLCGIALVLDGIENLYVAIYTVKLVKQFKSIEE